MMTPEEMKSMEGIEFIYIFPSGRNTMPSYVKRFDKETGKLSCWSFSLTTEEGKTFDPLNEDEEREGACCVVTGPNFKTSSKFLEEIKETGKIDTTSEIKYQYKDLEYFNGCVF